MLIPGQFVHKDSLTQKQDSWFVVRVCMKIKEGAQNSAEESEQAVVFGLETLMERVKESNPRTAWEAIATLVPSGIDGGVHLGS